MTEHAAGGLALSLKGEMDIDSILSILRRELEYIVNNGHADLFYGIHLYTQARKDNRRVTFYVREADGLRQEHKISIPHHATSSVLAAKNVQSTSTQQWSQWLDAYRTRLEQERMENEKKHAESIALRRKEEAFAKSQLARLEKSICQELGIDRRTWHTHVSGTGIVNDTRTIREWIGENVPMPPTPCFRVTYKNPETGKAGDVYRFDRDLRLLGVLKRA